MNTKIKFRYLNINIKCGFEDENLNACCCKCIFHHEVFKHCCHSPSQENCVCGESLGFYICNPPEIESAYLSGKHGMCEMFTKREKSDEEMKMEHNKYMKELKERMEKFKL